MRPAAGHLAHGGGRHRVAIDENGHSEALAGRLQKLGQGRMEQPLYALEGSTDGQPLAIDFLGIGDDAGDRPQAADDPRRLRVGKFRHAAGATAPD